jgi:D-glycero-D-manno-heptose 1,7-bisphosphate phosphatase
LILDRDGVINHDSDDYVRSVVEWEALPGSINAIAELSAAGWPVTVATNQSGIGRGYFSREAVYGMHRKLRRAVRAAGGEIRAIAFCPHSPDAGCDCRKPRTGLLQQLAKRTGLVLEHAVVIGDSLRDLEAGREVGADLWLVRTGKGERTLAQVTDRPPSWWRSVNVRADLAAVAESLRGTSIG